MPLTKPPFSRMQSLVGTHLSTKEDEDTQDLITELAPARKRGYLTRAELIKVCRWKSPRAIRHIRRNTEDSIRWVTRKALRTRSEQVKLELLMTLKGVSVPMASAILTLTNPRRYGVIDIRVWQLLHKMGSVSQKKKGVGFAFKHWYRFLMIIRHFAKIYGVNARDVERTLFRVHKLYQRGKLYG